MLFALRWLVVAALILFAARRRSLTTWILVAVVAGAVFGLDFPQAATELRILSTIFIRLIRTIIGPLLFATLVVGIAGHSNLKQVGRMGIKALVYFEVVTTLALFIGWAAITISRAGVGITLPPPPPGEQIAPPASPGWQDIVLHAFPENIAKAVADGEVLQIVVFSVLFGVALALLAEAKRRPLLTFCESLAETMFRFTNIVMLFAPIGVGAAIAYTVGHLGIGILVNLIKLLATMYAAVIVFVLGVLLPVALIARVPIRRFLAAAAEPTSIAFATASSEAALPRAMENMEAFGVPRGIDALMDMARTATNVLGNCLATVVIARWEGEVGVR